MNLLFLHSFEDFGVSIITNPTYAKEKTIRCNECVLMLTIYQIRYSGDLGEAVIVEKRVLKNQPIQCGR